MIFVLAWMKKITHNGRNLALNISTKLHQGQNKITAN